MQMNGGGWKEMTRRDLLRRGAGAAAGAIGHLAQRSACEITAAAPAPRRGGTLAYASSADVISLDPARYGGLRARGRLSARPVEGEAAADRRRIPKRVFHPHGRAEAQDVLAEQVPAVWLLQAKETAGMRRYLKGLRTRASDPAAAAGRRHHRRAERGRVGALS
jgi:hypothetical protein